MKFVSLKVRSAFFWDLTQRRIEVSYRRFRDNLSVPCGET
jgi:hypothetical protein